MKLSRCSTLIRNSALLLLIPSVGTPVIAGEWRLTSGVTAGLTYTDNVDLASSNPDSDMIATFSPEVSLSGKGARVNANLNASIEFNNLSNSSDSYNTQLQGNANVELVEQLLFVDANATITQNAVDPTSISGSDNLNNVGNKTTTTSLRVSPYVKGRLKSFANYELRLTHDTVSNDDVQGSDTDSQSASFSLNSGRDFKKFGWGINGSHKTTNQEQGTSNENTNLNVSLDYQINRKWQVNGTVGKEWNDITSSREDTNGFTWDLGARWTPSPRTDLDFGFGSRFFGNTKRMSFSHKNKRTVWTASYTHSLTDSHTLLSDQDTLQTTDPFGQPIDPITGLPIPVTDNLSAINNSSFVDQRFTTTFTLQGKRTTLSVNGDYSLQTYEDSSNETELLGLGVTVDRRLSGKVSANASVNWNESESKGTSTSSSETFRLGAGLSQRLGVKTNLRLNYSYTDRDSDQSGGGYDENRIALTLMHDF